MLIPYLDLDNKTLLFGPDTTRRATTDAPYPWSPAVIDNEARNNAVNFGAVFLNLTENNRVVILPPRCWRGNYRTDVVTGSR